MIFGKSKDELYKEAQEIKKAYICKMLLPRRKFFWLPKRLENGKWIWLQYGWVVGLVNFTNLEFYCYYYYETFQEAQAVSLKEISHIKYMFTDVHPLIRELYIAGKLK